MEGRVDKATVLEIYEKYVYVNIDLLMLSYKSYNAVL